MMLRVDTGNRSFTVAHEEFVAQLAQLQRKLEQEMKQMQEKVERYEKQRYREESLNQSLSPFKRLFTVKKPDHHLAVEQMVYLKRPLQEMEKMSRKLQEIARLLQEVKSGTSVLLSFSLYEELQKEGLIDAWDR
jgi:hypothetical protein